MKFEQLFFKTRSSTTIFSLICFLLLPLFTSGQSQDFEGIIYYEIPELESEIGTANLDYMIKNDMVRIEYKPEGKQSTSLLYKAEDGRMFLKISSLGGHVEIPPDDVKKNFIDTEVNFKKTDQIKQISERQCTVWEATVNKSAYQYCFVTDMGNFILPVNSMTAGSVPDWAGITMPHNKLPLEVVLLKNGRKEKTVMSTRRIEQTKLDKNLFSVFN